MDELTKKLLESYIKGYGGIVQEIRSRQDYLKKTVELISDLEAKNAPSIHDIPKIIEKSLKDTADAIKKQILGDKASSRDTHPLTNTFLN